MANLYPNPNNNAIFATQLHNLICCGFLSLEKVHVAFGQFQGKKDPRGIPGVILVPRYTTFLTFMLL